VWAPHRAEGRVAHFSAGVPQEGEMNRVGCASDSSEKSRPSARDGLEIMARLYCGCLYISSIFLWPIGTKKRSRVFAMSERRARSTISLMA
jgi:hypothetical protein